MTDSAPERGRPADRILVLFGATGDLAARKLLPGLFHLFRAGLLPEEFRIIGSGRHSPGTDDEFRELVRTAVTEHGRGEIDEHWDEFAPRLSFVASSAEDGSELAQAVTDAEQEIGAAGKRLVYLSVPPSAMQPMIGMLDSSGIAENCSLVLEKPFGHDAKSACELNAALGEVLPEREIYRIDHFLGKEAVLDLLALRFANALLEPIWNREHVCYVQIDVPEELDIEGRAAFYEQTGAVRDMIVTHLLQILGVVALEPPSRLDAEGLHRERLKVFEAIRPLDPARTVLGQYEGYHEEDDIPADSRVETFAALEVLVDSWRWSGVPFYLRTGKALAASRRTVTLGLSDTPLELFPGRRDGDAIRPDEIVIELSDDPVVRIDVRVKSPGPGLDLASAPFVLDVDRALGTDNGLEAYERLLHDVMTGDRLLFSTAEQIERLWEACAPILEDPAEPEAYARGSWGPGAALALPGPRGWRLPDDEGG